MARLERIAISRLSQLSKTEKNVLIPDVFRPSVRFSLSFFRSLCSQEARRCSAAPVVSAQIPDQAVYDATSALEIDLNTKFSDPNLPANTVRLTTVLGTIDVTLYDQQTPITVDNFLHYIDSGAYIPNDPNFPVPAPIFFHRSVPGFVIQSGGYISAQDPINAPVLLPGPVAAFSPIPNEARPDLHNVRGTIAMAKLPDDPDSATSQWFINLADNSGPPNNLDTLNGGFTVFGTVSAAGMTTADAIAALPNLRCQLPLRRRLRPICRCAISRRRTSRG